MNTCFISFGSNVGNRCENIAKAVQLVNEKIGQVCNCSSIYETEAWGEEDQENYYNGVLQIESLLNATQILEEIFEIELQLGRRRKKKWGRRNIDLDILFYEARVIKKENLQIPHPLLHKRNFVLVPLDEIASKFVHPVFKKSVRQLMKENLDQRKVFRLDGGC